jgi:hypothetical protein
MAESFNVEELQARFEALRRSEAFPAIVGAAAGGLTGALMAALIAGRRHSSSNGSAEVRTVATATPGLLLGYSPRDIIQLVTVLSSLARQIKEWRDASES